MDKKEELELKLEIYKTIYDGLVLDSSYLAEEMKKIEAQLEILEK